MERVVILGRGGAGKSALARKLGGITGLPVVELDKLFWQDGLNPSEPGRWAVQQRELIERETWILDGDLGPYDSALDERLQTADTVVVLDFSFVRCAWRTFRRGHEQADYWRWVWSYRRRYLPAMMQAIGSMPSTPRSTYCATPMRYGGSPPTCRPRTLAAAAPKTGRDETGETLRHGQEPAVRGVP